MRCKTCHYSLAGLTEHRCPECGNAFDPNDPSTFDVPTTGRREFWVRALIAVALSYLTAFLFCLQYLNAYNTRLGIQRSQSSMLRDAAVGGLVYIPLGFVSVVMMYVMLKFILTLIAGHRTTPD